MMKWFVQINIALGLLISCGLSVWAQTEDLTVRDADGRVVLKHLRGAFLGAYLGNAGRNEGAIVGKVLADSPAAKAGLQENDLIFAAAQQRIETAAQMFRWLTARKPQERVSLQLRRAGNVVTVDVTLGERQVRNDDPCQKLFSATNAFLIEATRLKAISEEAARKGDQEQAEESAKQAEEYAKLAEQSRVDVEAAIRDGRTRIVGQPAACQPSFVQLGKDELGVTVAPLTPQLATFFGTPANGLLVTEVKAGSPAAQAEIKVGDCLISLNNMGVSNITELKQAFAFATEPTVKAVIVRDQKRLTLQVAKR